MTYTDEELKASLRLAIGALELTPDYGINHSSVKDDDKASAVLRAYFDKFDEERALLNVAKHFTGFWPSPRNARSEFQDGWAQSVSEAKNDLIDAYRALMAKEKP